MSDGNGHSVKDGSDGGEILSAVNWDHGRLSLLSVQGGKYVQEGYRRLQSTAESDGSCCISAT